MVTIKCVNPDCKSPTKTFEWDEKTELILGGTLAMPHEPGAVRVVAVCPYDGTENVIWVKGLKTDDVIRRLE